MYSHVKETNHLDQKQNKPIREITTAQKHFLFSLLLLLLFFFGRFQGSPLAKSLNNPFGFILTLT